MHNKNAFGEDCTKDISKSAELGDEVCSEFKPMETIRMIDKTLHALLNISDSIPVLCKGADAESKRSNTRILRVIQLQLRQCIARLKSDLRANIEVLSGSIVEDSPRRRTLQPSKNRAISTTPVEIKTAIPSSTPRTKRTSYYS